MEKLEKRAWVLADIVGPKIPNLGFFSQKWKHWGRQGRKGRCLARLSDTLKNIYKSFDKYEGVFINFIFFFSIVKDTSAFRTILQGGWKQVNKLFLSYTYGYRSPIACGISTGSKSSGETHQKDQIFPRSCPRAHYPQTVTLRKGHTQS